MQIRINVELQDYHVCQAIEIAEQIREIIEQHGEGITVKSYQVGELLEPPIEGFD